VDAKLRRGDCHPFQKLGADLMSQAARAAVDHHHDVTQLEAEYACDLLVKHRSDFLYLEIVVAAAQCAHLVALAASLRAATRCRVFAMFHLSAFFDALKVLMRTPAALDRPFSRPR